MVDKTLDKLLRDVDTIIVGGFVLFVVFAGASFIWFLYESSRSPAMTSLSLNMQSSRGQPQQLQSHAEESYALPSSKSREVIRWGKDSSGHVSTITIDRE